MYKKRIYKNIFFKIYCNYFVNTFIKMYLNTNALAGRLAVIIALPGEEHNHFLWH